MTDEELLEFAAKAHGEVVYLQGAGWAYNLLAGDFSGWWNPLVNDADAFQLAVKLEITIVPSMEQASARNPAYSAWCNEDAHRDPCAAARRVIVRAAAEVGRLK
jgi:hypothetical protein